MADIDATRLPVGQENAATNITPVGMGTKRGDASSPTSGASQLLAQVREKGNMRRSSATPDGGKPVLRRESSKHGREPAMGMELRMKLKKVDGSFGLTLNKFLRVVAVQRNSAAALAGIKPFDRITAINGESPSGMMGDAVLGHNTVDLTIERPVQALHNSIVEKEDDCGAASPFAIRAGQMTKLSQQSRGSIQIGGVCRVRVAFRQKRAVDASSY